MFIPHHGCRRRLAGCLLQSALASSGRLPKAPGRAAQQAKRGTLPLAGHCWDQGPRQTPVLPKGLTLL